MSMPLLAVHGLGIAIADKWLATDIDLCLHAGQRLAILGRNGVGKTTLLHTLAGLRPPAKGEIRLAGKTYGELGARAAARWRGLLPQHQGDAFPATLLETVLIGRHPHLGRWHWEGERDVTLARAALAAVGLEEWAGRRIHSLSGGERQRVAIATLLAQQPRLYLLDEPLTHLDLNHQIAMLELLGQRSRAEDAALAMVLHDVNLAAHACDQALLLFGDGRALLCASSELDVEVLGHLYGHPFRQLGAGTGRWFVPELPQ